VTLSRVITTRGRGSSLLVDDLTNPEGPVIRAPRKVIEQLNDQFPMATQGNRFFTMVYGVMDTQTGVLNYTLAGQPPPVLVRRGRPAEQLDGTGFPVGVVTDPDFDEFSVDLEPGDRVFFYSDGITEAKNRQASMLGSEGLVRLIDACRDRPLNDCLSDCMQSLRKWSDSVPFDDDISMLAVEMPST
jgi:sigma-B regulation protein RsbU (phosphoserine phosphatase)